MPRSTVLAYHAVGPCSREQDRHNLFVGVEAFERQMRFLARRRTVVPLEAVVQGRVEGRRPAVAITFDDGYRSVLELAGPVLKRFGFPATVFVPTAWVGKSNQWDELSSCDLSIMRDDELLAAERSGISVESHGHAHLDMETAGPTEVEGDVASSAAYLEELLGRRPRFLAYPYGRSSDAARGIAERAGFQAAFSIERPDLGRYALERVQITSLDTAPVFALKSSGLYPKVRRSRVVTAAYAGIKPVVRRVLQARRR